MRAMIIYADGDGDDRYFDKNGTELFEGDSATVQLGRYTVLSTGN